MNNYSIVASLKSTQRGMTFLEVLIALVIMVTGILGAVAMQITAKQGSFDAMQRSLASSLAQDIIARMRTQTPSVNPDLALREYIKSDYGEGKYIDDASIVDMIKNDRYEWELALMGGNVTAGTVNVGGLIGGRGCIIAGVDVAGNIVKNAYTVVVSWQGRQKIKDSTKNGSCGALAAASGKSRQVVVQAFII
ncbi:type IV pilus modification protein PilV [Colwellia sp. 75C3]|nr:type IV pilus modification protein PilV [Colwellia sp. 75C3]